MITVDAAVPLISHPRHVRRHAGELRAGGVHAVLATVASIEDFSEITHRLAAWAAFSSPDAKLVRTVADIEQAYTAGQLALVLHMQGAGATGTTPDALHLFHAVGVRVIQLTYNYRNQLGDGCLESSDAGLSDLGRKCIRHLNDLGVMIDISHAGARTSLETIELADGPVVASHSNSDVVCNSPRNLSDSHIRAIAGTGGVIGLCAFPAFVNAEQATLDRLLDHAAYIADLVGTKHLGLGLDFSDEDEDDFVYFGYDERYYPLPPWQWPLGIEGFAETRNIPAALSRRGFADEEIAGIMGRNFLRAFGQRWGS